MDTMDIITELNHDFEIGGKNSIKWLEDAMQNAGIGFKLRLQYGLMLEACEYLEAYQKYLDRYQNLNDVFGDVVIKVNHYQFQSISMQAELKAASNAIRQQINIVAV